MIYAQIKNGIVVNKILINDDRLLSKFRQGFDAIVRIDLLEITPEKGWEYDGNEFTNPRPVVPPTNSDPISVVEYRASLLAVNHGTHVMAVIRAVNKKKLDSGVWSVERFQELMLDREAALIERALFNGSFETAAQLIQGFSKEFYTNEDKTFILKEIDRFKLILEQSKES